MHYRYQSILFFFLMSAPLMAQDVQIQQGEGLATIMNGDLAQAQYEARAAARVQALESLGIQVSSQVYTDQHRVLDATVLQKVEGYIERDRILSEEQTPDGQYRVVIEAHISSKMTDVERVRRQRNLVVVLDIQDQVKHQGVEIAKELEDRVVQAMVKDALIQQNFQVYTLRDIEEMRKLYKDLNQNIGSSLDTGSLMRLTLAGVWVHGNVESRFSELAPKVENYYGEEEQGVWYRGYPRVTASTAHGTPIPGGSVYEPEGIKVYKLNSDRAAHAALVASGQKVVSEIVEAISIHAQKQEVTFKVKIEGLPRIEIFRKYKRVLSNLRWVKSVESEDFQEGAAATYTVVYREKSFLFLSQLHRIPMLKVVEFEGYSVSVKYQSN